MTKILGPLIGCICLVYIDDVVVWGSTADECLRNVVTVVRKLREQGLLCNGSKCCLLSKRIELLGHIIEEGRVKPQVSKLEPLRLAAPPRNVREVQRTLGVLGYFRKFIWHYADISRPIYDVIRAANKDAGKPQGTAKQKAKREGAQKVIWTPDA